MCILNAGTGARELPLFPHVRSRGWALVGGGRVGRGVNKNRCIRQGAGSCRAMLGRANVFLNNSLQTSSFTGARMCTRH